ncbi:MAG: hypothetical protein GC152_16180 [Alphaproteobacteria bacterium]|nr:hypothetical protein [Alphaproteobacteria bacterium]
MSTETAPDEGFFDQAVRRISWPIRVWIGLALSIFDDFAPSTVEIRSFNSAHAGIFRALLRLRRRAATFLTPQWGFVALHTQSNVNYKALFFRGFPHGGYNRTVIPLPKIHL